ncbi:hypothetical protein [Candidatus Cyanaurora vandensis]|uniref:hypothetical protein n=1 Tax=Candidatus Cyanaurora vandensis TaxID=2714958 RepID=UPI002580C26A|nr:hypothetical protein [Candidatus Cyanaurora vandensis]
MQKLIALALVLFLPWGGFVLSPLQAATFKISAPKKLKKDAKNANKASFDDLTNVRYLNPSTARDVIDGRPWQSAAELVNRKNYFDLNDQKILKKALEEGYLFVK